MSRREYLGEALGTFLLVLFGCGSVAVSVLFSAHEGLMQVALAWGVGVMLAIYLTRHLSCAHLNPAVSLAMAIGRRMPYRRLPGYIVAQLAGAFLAGLVLYGLFGPSIAAYEHAHQITRAAPESVRTAMIFGEYYPHPGMAGAAVGLVAPLTQAGLNPARDFGPRLVAWMMGWGDAAFPDRVGGFLFVYILARRRKYPSEHRASWAELTRPPRFSS